MPAPMNKIPLTYGALQVLHCIVLYCTPSLVMIGWRSTKLQRVVFALLHRNGFWHNCARCDVCIQQCELVSQLQEQHYEQYMSHVHTQLVLHQRQQLAQLQSLHHHHQQQPVLPSNQHQQHVEFHTEADTCHHDDVVMVTGGKVNGASDTAAPLLDRRHSNDDDDGDDDESDDDAESTGKYSWLSVRWDNDDADSTGTYSWLSLSSRYFLKSHKSVTVWGKVHVLL